MTSPRATRAGGNAQVQMTCAADIKPKDVEWLWRDRIPLGMLTLFAGNPKVGKSYMTLEIAARVSRGEALPAGDIPNGPASVLLMSAEDDPACTIVPRLIAAGADLKRIQFASSAIGRSGEEAPLALPADIDAIEQSAANLESCRLIVIDPISAYLVGVDDHKNAESRRALFRLTNLAKNLNAAVLLVTHLNKRSGVSSKQRVQGSIAWGATSRANFLFVPDPEDPTGRTTLFLENGCNLVHSVPGLAYVIEDQGGGPRVKWTEKVVSIQADEALQSENDNTSDNAGSSEHRDCDQWLREVLGQGPEPMKEVMECGVRAGFSVHMINRAKKRTGVKSKREGCGKGSKVWWHLPKAIMSKTPALQSTNSIGR